MKIFITLTGTLLLAVLFWTGRAEMWHVYLLLACRSAGSAFHRPAMQASVPMLAPEAEFTRIAGVNQIIVSFSDIAGPADAGGAGSTAAGAGSGANGIGAGGFGTEKAAG